MKVRDLPRVTAALSFVWAVALHPSAAGTIGLAWDPVSDPDLAGYRVYYGAAPGNYTQQIDLGAVTGHTLGGVSDCTTWYVAVKAVDAAGQESNLFSNEISGWARPTVLGANPSSAQQGQRLDITITGTNFQPGASVAMSSPDLLVHSVTVTSCSELVADVTVGGGAPIGTIDVDVVNPDQVFGTGTGVFSVSAADGAPGRVLNLRRSDVLTGS
jgi:hypothetical protein